MVSGNPEEPISVSSHLGLSGRQEDKTHIRHLLIRAGIITGSGGFNLAKARKNLGSKPQNNT